MMAIKTENWLGEFVSTIGTGDAILGGAIDGFAGFSNVGDDVDVYYTIIDGLDKETGIGTLTGGKLVRKDIHATLVDGAYVKNGSAINLSGNAQVYGTANAHFLDYVQAVSNAEIVNTQAIAELKSLQINGHALTASFNLTAADVRAHPDSWMPSTEALNVYQKDVSDIRYIKTQDAEQVAGLVMRVGGAREQQLQQSINSVQDFIDAQTFANVDAMLAFNGLVVGQKYSTGFTTWRYIGGGGTIDRFKPLNGVHIDDFGASTSQAVDSLGAINRALAVKGTVRAGVGTYYISSEILIGSDTRFVGAGKFYTIIRPNQTFIDTAAINGLNIIKNIEAANPTLPLYNANRDIVISDMQFRYNDSNGGVLDKINCIGFNNAKRLTVRDCYAANLSQHFVDICGCDEVLIENNTVVNGYWSSIQIDNGGGLYNIQGFPTTAKSINVKIIRNTLTGSKAGVGAIQMHKKGGDNVTIEDNTIVGGVSGIVADDYFANTFPIEASSDVRILNNYVSVSGAALNLGKSLTNAQVTGNTLISTGSSFAMRLQAGDGSTQYWDNATVSDNKCFGNVHIVGLRKSAIYGNNFEDQTTEAVLSTKETIFSTNNLEIKGVIHKDISFTDPRDGVTVRNYTLSNNKVAYNVCNNGSGVGFAVESSGFNLIEYIDNTPFATANGYNFSLAVVKTGLIINDFFRKALRAGNVSDLPEPIIGQQAFYLNTKKPVWYNGTAWIYADGSTVFP